MEGKMIVDISHECFVTIDRQGRYDISQQFQGKIRKKCYYSHILVGGIFIGIVLVTEETEEWTNKVLLSIQHSSS